MKNIKHIITIFILIFSWELGSAQYSEKEIYEYIDTYKELAINKMYEYKIPASITLAQGIFESGCGTSRLASEGNNHFGIKCHKEWTGDTLLIDDDELQECFRKYNTAEESYNDHSLFLKGRPRYSSLFTLDILDYVGWAKGLKEAGYATNPEYANRIINLIEKFNIAKLDTLYNERLMAGYFKDYPNVTPPSLAEQTEPQEFANDDGENKPTSITVFTAFKDEFPAVEYPFTERSVYVNNNTYFVIAQKGDSYSKIAKDLQTSVKKLKKYNNITTSGNVKIDQVVYIERKSKTGKEEYYKVQNTETLHYISQKTAVDLNKIYKYNGLTTKSKVKKGDIIKLQK